MRFMHQPNKRQLLFLLAVPAVLLLVFLLKNLSSSPASYSDKQFLLRLKNQPIALSAKTKCVMICNQMDISDIRVLFSDNNIDYTNSNFTDSASTMFAIQGTTKNKLQIRFTLKVVNNTDSVTNLIVQNSPPCNCN